MAHDIYFRDARRMHDLDDGSVHLVVTSPPYWKLKDYGTRDQIGFDQDYSQYVESLDAVWSEVDRVLHPGCRVAVNIGDQFMRSKTYGRYCVIPIRTAIVTAFERLGHDYMGAIIWQKATTVNSTGGGVVMGSYPRPRNGVVKIDYEFILLFKKLGPAPKVSAEQKEASALSAEEWNRFFSGHWTFSGERHAGHHAMFPVELPRRLIRMFSFPGETVLDPFLGSGTTIAAAHELGRRGVGYELNRGFEPVIAERVAPDAELRFHGEGAEAADVVTTPPDAFFGSAVRSGDVGRQRWKNVVRVTAVVSPIEVRTESGEQLRLEGLLAPSQAGSDRDEACRLRLEELVLGKRVAVETTSKGRAFVRLLNRTMINSVLLREGLAPVDVAAQHRNAARFCTYARDAGVFMPGDA